MSGGVAIPGAASRVACRVCGEPILAVARRCPHCRSWQARWRNALPTVALIAGLVVLVGGAVAGLVGAVRSLEVGAAEAGSAPDGVTVIAFATGGSLVVRNTGRTDVFVDGLAIDSPAFAHQSHIILGAVAKPGTFQPIAQPAVASGPLVANVSDEVWQQVLAKQFPEVQPRFYSADHVYLRAVSDQVGDGVRTIPARCRLTYQTLTSTAAKAIEFDCTGVFVRIAGDAAAAAQ